jgi:hypothetical protein
LGTEAYQAAVSSGVKRIVVTTKILPHPPLQAGG